MEQRPHAIPLLCRFMQRQIWSAQGGWSKQDLIKVGAVRGLDGDMWCIWVYLRV